MKQLTFESFFIPEKGITPVNVRLDVPGAELELYVVGGGPVFLFEMPIDENEAFFLVNEEKELHPHYLLAACKGQAAYRNLNHGLSSEIVAYADAPSIGHIRTTC